MHESPEDSLDFTLDLVFNSGLGRILEGSFDAAIKFRLTQSEPWTHDLRHWIHTVRNDLNLTCPAVVRKASALSMGLQFADDLTIARLNANWRDRPEKTDVLSFPVVDEKIGSLPDEPVELGDIVVSLPTAQRQAREMKHELGIELQWLVSHGLLHLLGWDHPNPTRLKEMLNCQNRLLGIKNNSHHLAGENLEITDAS